MKLIDKDALVAEIERRLRELLQLKKASYEIGLYDAYKIVLSFIDSMQEDPVREELEEAAWVYYEKNKPLMPKELALHREFVSFFKAGAEWQIAKLIKDATEVTVHIDAGNYPYIPQIELYDYDKDIPLAKEGDKYKVILIKED